jgi:hypothetical protein
MATHQFYTRHRYPAEVISHAVWLYFRFPLSLRMVEEVLAARGILVSYETVREWGRRFGREFAKPPKNRARGTTLQHILGAKNSGCSDRSETRRELFRLNLGLGPPGSKAFCFSDRVWSNPPW